MLGCCTVLYGILAGQACHSLEYHPHGGLWHAQLYFGRSSSLRGQWRVNVGDCWDCHRRTHLLDCRGFWHDTVPHIREVMSSLISVHRLPHSDGQLSRLQEMGITRAYTAPDGNGYLRRSSSSSLSGLQAHTSIPICNRLATVPPSLRTGFRSFRSSCPCRYPGQVLGVISSYTVQRTCQNGRSSS